MSTDPIRVLFVCLGNICRSPLAEGVFRHLVREAGLGHRFEVDSAGTSGYHVGEPPDARAREVSRRRGIDLQGSARQLESADLERFDYIIAMDVQNLREVERLARRASGKAEVHLLREFDSAAGGDLEVPDPYYGGPDGFERVHELVERACRGLLEHIRGQYVLEER